MAKDAAITVRIPAALKRRLEAVARKERRSLSAQITAVLEREAGAHPGEHVRRGKLLGRYEGTTVPTEKDFQEVRRLLWGRLGQARGGRRSGRAA